MRHFALAVCLLAWPALVAAGEAGKLFREGQKAEKAGQVARAYLLYAQAAALDPGKQIYWLRSQALRTRAAIEAKVMPPSAAAAVGEAAELPAADPEDLAEARKPLPPFELRGAAGRRDLDLQGDAKTLWEQVARAFGLDTVFDGDFDPGKPLRFRMQQADYREALRALEAATASFIVPLSDRLFLVARDSPQKRAQVEPSVAVTVPIPETTAPQDFMALVQGVQQSLGIQKAGYDTQSHTVVLRDAVSKIAPARRILKDLLHPRAQVEVEIEILEVASSATRSFGIDFPNTFPIVTLTTVLNNRVSLPETIKRLRVFGGGQSLFGIGIADPTLIARMSETSGKTLLNSTLRSVDGQPAQLTVGDKYPVLTGGYFGPPEFSGPDAYLPPPSFTFEDLGMNVKLTPRVHGVEEVSLEIEAEFKVLTGQALNGIPVIANRRLASKVRLRLGEWAVVAGLMNAQEARTVAGVAGLSRLPVAGHLFSTRTRDQSGSQVLVLVKPRLLTLPPDQVVTTNVRVGSETRPLTPL